MKNNQNDSLNLRNSTQKSPNHNKLGISIVSRKDYYEKT